MWNAVRFKWVLTLVVLMGVGMHWNIWQLDIMGIHAWRQTQTMTVVENFATEDMHILDPRINSRGSGDGIFRMEFPLMQWAFAWVYKLFGHHLVLIRVLSFGISLFSFIGFYRLLRQYRVPEAVSALGMWTFAWSPVLYYYAVNPMPDNLALCLGIWSLVHLKRHQVNGSMLHLGGFAVLLSVATAVKLPFVLFGAAYIPIFFAQNRAAMMRGAALVTVCMAPALLWYAWVIPQWGTNTLTGGIGAEVQVNYITTLKHLWGVFHSLLPELLLNFAAIPFFLIGIVITLRSKRSIRQWAQEFSLLVAVVGYYLYEVNMIGIAHDYYLFPFLPSIFLVVARGIKWMLGHANRYVHYAAMVLLLSLPAISMARVQGRWRTMGMELPLLQHKVELQTLVPDTALVVAGNDVSTHIFLYHIKKKGWTFANDALTAAQLHAYRLHGARFLYCNTSFVENDPALAAQLLPPLFRKDGLAVYPLRQQ